MTRFVLRLLTVLCLAIGSTATAAAQPFRTFTLNGIVADVIAPDAIVLGELFYMSVELRAPQGSEPLQGNGVIVDGRPLGRGEYLPLGPGIADGIPNNFEWYGSSSLSATPGDIVLHLTVVESTGRGGVIALPMRLLSSTDEDGDTLPDKWERNLGLSAESATGNDGSDGDPDGDGLTNRDEFLRHSHPRGFHVRYFPEGVSSDFFDTTLRFTPLPGGSARVLVRTVDGEGWTSSYTESLNVNGGQVVLGPFESTTRRPGNSFATILESDGPIVAERSTKWPTWRVGSALPYGSHNSEGTASLSTRWLFAEGVIGAFHTYVTLLNPSSQTATLTVTYYGADGSGGSSGAGGVTPLVRHHIIAPDSRATIDVNVDAAGLASNDLSIAIDSSVPIAAERSIYRDVASDAGIVPWGAGTSTVGAAAPSLAWFFAEGVSNTMFDTYLLLFNPETTAAQVEIEVLRADGGPITLTRTIAPRSRATVHLSSAHAALASASFGIAVRGTNGVPIVAERTVWWSDPMRGTRWIEGHTSMGAPAPATRWFAAGNGLTGAGGDVNVYLLLANPGAAPATVRVTLTDPSLGGPRGNVDVVVPAHGRLTLHLPGIFPIQPGSPDGRLDAVLVESLGDAPAPIVAERSVYSNTLSVVWEIGSNTLLTPLPPQ
jgi:hypothetical protein